MFDLLPHLSFLSGAASTAQVALKTSGNWLPSPSVFAGLSGLMVLLAAGAGILLRDARLAVYCVIGAVFFAFAAAIGFGYEAKGENNIIPKLNAANAIIASDQARADSFRADIAALQSQLSAKQKALKAARAAAAQHFMEAINAQPASVSSAPTPLPASVPINAAIAEANVSIAGPGAGDAAAAAAGSPAQLNIRDWQVWSGKVIDQYRALADEVKGLQADRAGIDAAAAKADAEHPTGAP